MVWVTAKTSFDHNGPKKRGDEFEVSEQAAEQLKRRRLVTLTGDAPKPEGGTQSSASPVAQALPLPTPTPSANGDTLPPLLPPVTKEVPVPTPPPLPPVTPANANKPKPVGKPKPKA